MKRLLLLALAGCASFDDPNIVADLRVVSITADPPEQVVDIDLAAPNVADVLAQLVPAQVCALVADPGRDRGVAWSMTLCALDDDGRCTEEPTVLLRDGIAADPDTATPRDPMCATIPADTSLAAVAGAALMSDDFGGLGGIDYGVSLAVVGADEPTAPAQYALKSIRLSARLPAARRANVNPSLDGITAIVDESGEAVPLPLGRCADQTAPLEVATDTVVRLTPVETAGAREDYVVPTLTGGERMFTESLTYQWLAGAGHLSSGSTGGPRDFSGNPAILYTDFRSPEEPGDVPLWLVQRDERLGVHAYESCVRVTSGSL